MQLIEPLCKNVDKSQGSQIFLGVPKGPKKSQGTQIVMRVPKSCNLQHMDGLSLFLKLSDTRIMSIKVIAVD